MKHSSVKFTTSNTCIQIIYELSIYEYLLFKLVNIHDYSPSSIRILYSAENRIFCFFCLSVTRRCSSFRLLVQANPGWLVTNVSTAGNTSDAVGSRIYIERMGQELTITCWTSKIYPYHFEKYNMEGYINS